MSKYEIVADYEEESNIIEVFTGSWDELQEEIKNMRRQGYYHISAECREEDEA